MVQEHLDLQETDFGYSLKNIPQPSRKEYLHALLSQTQSFMNRLRWKAFFILHPDEAPPEKENFGFRTQKSPPQIPELDLLQKNLLNILQNIKFKKGGNRLQAKMSKDLEDVKRDQEPVRRKVPRKFQN